MQIELVQLNIDDDYDIYQMLKKFQKVKMATQICVDTYHGSGGSWKVIGY